MAREQRKDVDYFPHECIHGRKMHIIQKKYKNDGYAAWFKLLEELGKANNHYIDISDETTLMFLASTFDIDEDMTISILNDLAKLGAIDKFLFDNYQVIWSEKFKKSIEDAYRKRKLKIFEYSDVLNEIKQKNGQSGGSYSHTDGNTAEVIPKVKKSKVKESKEENSKEEGSSDFPNPSPPKIDYKKFIDFFNENRGNMPEIKTISKPREIRISNLIKNHSKENLMEVILNCKNSNFIQGMNDRSWVADFDWITKPANFIKILEGNYKNKDNGKSNSGPEISGQNRNR